MKNQTVCCVVRRTAFAITALWLLWLSIAGAGDVVAAEAERGDGPTVLLTGADREIGLAFAREYAGKGWSVIASGKEATDSVDLQALADEYSNVTVENLDVSDFDAIDRLAEKYRGRPIDLLLSANRITVAEAIGGMEAQKFGQFDYAAYDQMARINALAPLKLFESFYQNVEASEHKKFVTVSSSNGVIGSRVKTKCRRCGNFFGKASFATTSMIIHRVDMFLRGRDSEIVVGLLNPGPVDIAAVKPLVADNFPADSLISVSESVSAMTGIIENYYTLETSGQFIDYRGHQLPW